MMRHIRISCGFVVILAAASGHAADFFEPVQPPRPFQVMAHRGMSAQAPENTRPAIERVYEDGFEWAEVDVRLTKDHQHVIFHDSSVDAKSDGHGEVRAMTLKQLKTLDLGSWFAPRYQGERILTMRECLELAKGKVNLYLDCKDVDPDLLVKEILDAGMEKQVVAYEDLEIIARIRERSQGRVPVMTKWHPNFGLDLWIDNAHLDAVEIDADEVTSEVCRAFHAKGVKVQAKVLDDADRPEVWDRVIEAGVDWLQTDLPEEIIARGTWQRMAARPVMISCHRGANRYAPENTIAAFEKAVRIGVDYVEFDVRPSKDGDYFILHDGRLDRTTDGAGAIRDMPTAHVRGLSAGEWFGLPFAEQKVPTLGEMYDTLGGRAHLYYDAKDISPEDLARGLEERKQVESAVVYQSPSFLVKLRAINPAIRALCPLGQPDEIEKLAEQVHPYAFDTDWDILSKELIDKCHALGIKVFSDSMGGHEKIEDYQQAIAWGIDLIQTDHPLRVMRAAELIAGARQ